MNDIDNINFISNEEIQNKMRSADPGHLDLDLINKFPQIKIPNRFYKNSGNLQFTDIADRIENAKSGYSNGAVYADFDNDGDLDVVVNNLNEPALFYENKSNDKKQKAFVEIKLKGPEKNINAVGSKVVIYTHGEIRTYEKYPVRGFLSSAETPVHIGLDKTQVDSAFLIWPDNSFQRIDLNPAIPWMNVAYVKNLPKFDYRMITDHWKKEAKPMKDITSATKLLYKSEENDFHEFDREPLIPHLLSTEGPALAVGDLNGDGLEDAFLGSSKGKKSVIFFQDKSGKFIKTNQVDIEADSLFEDIDACIVDVNHDGYPDLVVASGGNEFYAPDIHLSPRVYLNNGKGKFIRKNNAFDSLFINASCVADYDFNGDGYPDLFIGGRSVPNQYGETPRSYLLLNDGTGHFTDVTEKYSKELSHIGFVTKALWFDLDKDGKKDLILSLEWGGIVAFMNHSGSFSKKLLTEKKGWWNFILPVDLNHDGNIDLIAGNLGLNSKLKASEKEPVRMYYSDFGGNGRKEQILTYFLAGREIPFATKSELERQIPDIKKQFLYAEDFAKASLPDIFSPYKLNNAKILTADYFANAVLINDGNLNFSVKALPWEAQFSPYKDAVIVNANDDSLPDILIFGNYYENNIQMGRYDADFGTILINKGNGVFNVETINGLQVKGQVRHIRKIKIANKESFILARNNDSTMVMQFARP